MGIQQHAIGAARAPEISSTPVSAAKLSVLHLEPIKDRLGPRWDRLSGLVHQLFEKALRGAQGRHDHFVLMDELSYVATFHDLTPYEAEVACTSVAKEVCDLLFGEGSEAVSIRSLIGTVSGGIADFPQNAGAEISSALERDGKASITTHHPPLAGPPPESYWIGWAHKRLAALTNDVAGFYPAWDLQRKRSSWLSFARRPKLPLAGGVAAKAAEDEKVTAELEIAFLRASADYALMVQHSGQVCPIASGVSYNTLSGFHSRMRYIQALKSLALSPSCPLFLKIARIPDGTPLARLWEIVLMISEPGTRILLEFADIRRLPALDIRLNVAGVGAVLPERCTENAALHIARCLLRRSAEQKGFAFLGDIAAPRLLKAIVGEGVHYVGGIGPARPPHWTGNETIPRLPLDLPPEIEKFFV
ncbi:MAG TPA: hypothetical protein VNW15_14645 [Rhizomicrobium sp.]|nr:hypothetical protein [Rhizomicrobium sp.]